MKLHIRPDPDGPLWVAYDSHREQVNALKDEIERLQHHFGVTLNRLEAEIAVLRKQCQQEGQQDAG